MICPNCNTENPSYARFCQECGSELEINEAANCPACNQGKLTESTRKRTFNTKYSYQCDYCGAVFEEKGDKYKLTFIRDPKSPIWQRYRNKPLTFDEWTRIANGGISDAEQKIHDAEEKRRKMAEAKEQKKREEQQRKLALREAEAQKERDVNQFINNLAAGNVNLTSNKPSPMIMKKGETVTIVMNNISFMESRSVRQTIGGYGGPSFRVAKGVSFRFGGVSARSVSHEELKKIDRGSLVLTNKRLAFLGSMRTINIDLRKIVAIEPYKDGIGSQRENKQKTEYFTGTQNTVLNFTKNGRNVSIPLNGVVLRAAVMGNISKLS